MKNSRELKELGEAFDDLRRRMESDPRSLIGLSGESYYDVREALKKERKERKKFETPPKDGMVFA